MNHQVIVAMYAPVKTITSYPDNALRIDDKVPATGSFDLHLFYLFASCGKYRDNTNDTPRTAIFGNMCSKAL
jgi:hypothetical protein